MVDLHNAELSTITYCDAVAWIEASAVETQRGGFARLCVDVGGVAFDGVVGGSEPAVLLLHGFPQTHLAWRFVASRLAHTHTVVATDLPGYSRVRLLLSNRSGGATVSRTCVFVMMECVTAVASWEPLGAMPCFQRSMTMIEPPRAEIDGIALNRIRTGPRNTSTVVLVHAVGYDLTYWDRQIEALLSKVDVVAFDLPGHGRSAGGPQECRFDRLSAIVAHLIRETGAHPVHLVGISFGGMVAQTTVLAYPELIRSLTLIGTAARFSDPVRAAMRARADTIRNGGMASVLQSSLERWFTPETMERRPDIIDRVSKTVLGDDPEVQAAIWDLIANDFDVHDRLGEIHCPTLVLVGERDPSTPISASAALAEGIAGAEIQILPATSHLATIESPNAVNAALLRFIAAH